MLLHNNVPFLFSSVVLLCWLPSVLVLELVGLTILCPPVPAEEGRVIEEGALVFSLVVLVVVFMVVMAVMVVVVELFSLSLSSSSLSPSNASGTGERLSSSLLLGGYVCERV